MNQEEADKDVAAEVVMNVQPSVLGLGRPG